MIHKNSNNPHFCLQEQSLLVFHIICITSSTPEPVCIFPSAEIPSDGCRWGVISFVSSTLGSTQFSERQGEKEVIEKARW